MSTAIMRFALAALQPIKVARPIAPSPQTAHVDPSSTCERWIIASDLFPYNFAEIVYITSFLNDKLNKHLSSTFSYKNVINW